MEWAAKHKLRRTEVVHVIDDSLFLAHSLDHCNEDLAAFIDLRKQIGVHWVPYKTVVPQSSITFLGILFWMMSLWRLDIHKINWRKLGLCSPGSIERKKGYSQGTTKSNWCPRCCMFCCRPR